MARILVVDEAENLLKLYQRELQDDGHEVKTALGAREAIGCCGLERPDLVIFDVRHAERVGIEAVAQLKSINRGVPLILHTAYSPLGEHFALRLADACVNKSSDLAPLKRVIKDLLSTRAIA